MSDVLDRLKAALADRYAVERELGSGGMAVVYLAHDLRHERLVAIKVLRPELASVVAAERFLREIKLTAALTHPHILPLLDSGEADGLLYYVMPYVEGESLRERLTREKQLPVDDAVRIACEAADALSYAHGRDLLHRDIKPENILLAEGHAVVADFGIARALSDAAGDRLTDTGISIGTPTYMSPEQAAGEREIGVGSDLYSLACVLYEMLTGEPPIFEKSMQAAMSRKLLGEFRPAGEVRGEVPADVDAAVSKALATEPGERFATAGEFGEALRSPEVGSTIAAPRRARRRKFSAATAGLVALALAVAAGWYLGRDEAELASDSKRLVVLPFEHLGAAEDEYYTDEIIDEIRTRLQASAALHVIARASSVRYKNTEKTIEEIRDELDVDYLVDGTFRRVQLESGERPVRVTAELIRTSDGVSIWTDSYNALGLAIFDVQIGIVEQVVEALAINLLGAEREAVRARPTDDPQAHEDYLRGLHQFNKRTKEGWEAAIADFQRAIDRDPSYAQAHAWMSAAYVQLSYYSLSPPLAMRSRALEAAERALALDNSLAQAHASLSSAKFSFDWDWAAGDQASREAARLDPNSTYVLFSRAALLSWVGRHEEAIEMGKRIIELEPVAPLMGTWMGMLYFLARRYDEAIAQLNKVLALEPDYRDARVWLSYSYARKGMHEEAARESAIVTGYRQSWWPEAWILAVAGKSAQASNLIDQIPAEDVEIPINSYFLAPILGELGEKDRAFDALERAYEGRTPLMSMLKVDPRLDSLRDDPRFEDLLRRMNFPE
jgi:serine/threonine-protein kinase